MHKPVPRVSGIPPLIKRNTVLFALSQSFIGAGTQLAYGIGPLMVIAVTGSASLAGLTVGLFGISRFLGFGDRRRSCGGMERFYGWTGARRPPM